MTAPAWQPRAACNDYPTDLWFPPRGDTGVDAKRVCVTCPVRLDCLWDRLERGDQGFEGGIRGGHGGAVTRHLRRLWRRSALGGIWPIVFLAAVIFEGERLVAETRSGRAPDDAPDRSGPNARHGTIARYKNGCSGRDGCGACYLAMVMNTTETRYREADAA